jgi:hypothetical protein
MLDAISVTFSGVEVRSYYCRARRHAQQPQQRQVRGARIARTRAAEHAPTHGNSSSGPTAQRVEQHRRNVARHQAPHHRVSPTEAAAASA